MGYLTRNVSHTLGWFLQRLTAIFLALGLLVHFWVLHFVIERPVTFEKVQERLFSPFWIAFDLLLLAAAIYHALNGLWNLIMDYNLSTSIRKILGWVLFLLGTGGTIFGYYILMPLTSCGGVR